MLYFMFLVIFSKHFVTICYFFVTFYIYKWVKILTARFTFLTNSVNKLHRKYYIGQVKIITFLAIIQITFNFNKF
jgi:hypothetical protein